MDTITESVALAAKVTELDFARRALLNEVEAALEFYQSGGSDEELAYARGRFYGLTAGLFYSGMISMDDHKALCERMLEAIRGQL